MPATIQTIQTPKRARALDTSTSLQSIGTDLVIGGNFPGSASSGDAGTTEWAFSGADDNVSIAGGKLIWDGGAPDNAAENVYQGTGQGLVVGSFKAGRTYKVTYTLTGLDFHSSTSSKLRCLLYSQDPSPVDGKYYFGEIIEMKDATGKRRVNGTYTEYVTISNPAGSNTNQILWQSLVDPISAEISNFSIYECESFGNNNHGQIYSGRALEFDGVADNLVLTGDDTQVEGITKFTASPFTCSLWLYINSATSSTNFYIGTSSGAVPHTLGMWNESSYYSFYTRTTNQKNYFGFSEDGSGGVQDARQARNAAGLLKTWIRCVIVNTNDSDRTLKLYINGELWGYIDNDTVRLTDQTSSGVTETLFSQADNRFDLAYVGAPYSGAALGLDGMISDFQIWDSAWSTADVTYDYLNPEQLALNRGGTSLTESNLKVWYPMQDGHRGQQSFILDGANTGLGDDVVSDGGFDTDVAESITGTYWVTAAGWVISGGKAIGSGTTANLRQVDILTVGTTYKVRYEISNYTSGSVRIELGDDNAMGETVSANGIYEEYIAASTTYAQFDAITSFTGSLDNISIKPVNAKNHATTVFYGDNTIVAGNDDRGMGGTNNWDAYGTGTSELVTGGKLKVTTTTAEVVQGAELPLANSGTPVAGRTYRIRTGACS